MLHGIQLVDCSMQVRKSSIRDIPEEQVKIMLDVLKKISQNRLMTTASTIQGEEKTISEVLNSGFAAKSK